MKETNKLNRLGGLFDTNTKHQAGAVWDRKYLCPPLDTAQGGLRMPLTIIRIDYDSKCNK